MRPRAGRTSSGSLRAPDEGRQRSGPVPSAHDAAILAAEAAARHPHAAPAAPSPAESAHAARALAEPESAPSSSAEAASAAPSSEDASQARQAQRQRLRAAGQDAVAAAFFASPPAVDAGEQEDWGVEAPPLDPAARRAMWATFAILALALFGIGAYVAYHRLVMPVPVELHTTQPADGAH